MIRWMVMFTLATAAAAMTVIAQGAQFNIPADLLVRGDYSDKEILRYRRIRVERQEVLYDDTQPMICRLGSTVLVAGQKGSLARSNDGGIHWENLGNVMESVSTKCQLLALGALSGDTILAAVQRDRSVTIVSSGDQGETWQKRGMVEVPGTVGDLRGRFVQLADNSVLLSLAGAIFRSTDDGANWSHHTTLPTGLSALRPVVLRSGRLLAAALYEGDDSQEYRNTVIAESTNNGKTWKILAAATRIGQVPGDLVELSGGKLVLSYGEESYPHGARALVSSDGGKTWGEETYVIGQSRYGLLLQPRPEACEPASGIATVVLDDGVIVSAYDRGKTLKRHAEPADGRQVDEWGHVPAIVVTRWTPEGFKKPPLVYPNLLSTRVDSEGYLDNGLVRMRPDDRFEGGDYIENYETIVYRRLPAEQLSYGDIGRKGVIVCRHPDGSLVATSRLPEIYRSTDEGRSWTKIADIPRPTSNLKTSNTACFGVTRKGTYLVLCGVCIKGPDPATGGRHLYKHHIGRSTDGGKTWDFKQIDPGPKYYGGNGDSCRINQLSDGTILINSATAWIHPRRDVNYGEVLLRSRDDGQTWNDFTTLPPNTTESNLLELPGGRLLCATRMDAPGEITDHFFGEYGGDHKWEFPSRNYVGEGRYKNEAIMFSDDGGYNWTKPFFVTRIHDVSADVVRDQQGRIVLTYGHKDANGGSRARVSTDGGLTWQEENYILCYERVGQRTSSVVLKDGRILTLWAGSYSFGFKGTIWSPE